MTHHKSSPAHLRPWVRWGATLGGLLTALLIACGPGSTMAPADDETDPPKLLLLRSGAVVEGTILLSGDDYLVKLPKGNMLVPRQLVRLACRDLQEAYRALHDRAALQGEGEAYLSLARWCLNQKLFDEANFELQTALDLEPGLDEARQLMSRTAELQREHARNALNAGVVVPEPSREKSDTEAEALGGLSPELAGHFARRIQPLLVNNCASTGCHGPRSETGFRLQRVTSQGGPNRLAADRNLASVLNQLNLDKPTESPLLLAPRGNHGRRGKPLFGGVTGKEQYAELKSWTLAVAKEEVVQARARRQTGSPSPTGAEPSPRSEIQLLEGSEESVADPARNSVVPAFDEQAEGSSDPFAAPPARLPPVSERRAPLADNDTTAGNLTPRNGAPKPSQADLSNGEQRGNSATSAGRAADAAPGRARRPPDVA
ncbi:MAG: tetratricopeptide repeat protein, partial [Planctomycetaceae bacterium]